MKVPGILYKAQRQHRHNYGSEELIPAFDFEGTIKIVNELEAENESLKCCGNCKNDIYCLSPICVQCTRGVQITTASDKKDNWESK